MGQTDVVLAAALTLIDRLSILADASSRVRDLHPLKALISLDVD